MSISGYTSTLAFQIKAAKLPKPVLEHRFHPVRRWKFDISWPDFLFYVEVDGGTWMKGGGRHNRGKGYENDCIKLNTAALLGWRGLRVTTSMVKSGAALNAIQEVFGVGCVREAR